MGIILLFLFWLALCLFGWQFSKLVLKEQRLEFLIPLAPIIGMTFYLFTLNILGYFFPITSLFLTLTIFYGLVGEILLIFTPRTINKPTNHRQSYSYSKIFLIFLAISLFVLVIGLRSLSGDEIAIGSLPTIATISEGNFPIVRLDGPPTPLSYHYAPLLLAAAVHKITTLPIWYITDIHRAIFIFIFSTLIFAILFFTTRQPKKSLFISLVVLLASNLAFLNIFQILPVIFDKFIRHVPVNYKFITNSFNSFFSPFLKIFNIEWVPLAFILFTVSVFLYFRLLSPSKTNFFQRLGIFITLVISVSLLGLTAETYLAVLLFSFLVYPFLAYLLGQNRGVVAKNFLISLVAIIISAIIVRYQGGVLTSYSTGSMSATWAPSFFSSFPRYVWAGHGNLYPWSSFFITQLGFLFILIIPALVWLFRKNFSSLSQEVVLFALASFVAFAVPFCVALDPAHNHELARFFYLTSAFWALLVALAIFNFIEHYPKIYFKIGGFIILLIMVASGLIYLVAYIIIPAGRTADHLSPFFQYYLVPTNLEKDVYSWVKQNTTGKDHFLTYSDPQIPQTPNAKFIVYTGRLASRYQFVENFYTDVDPELVTTFQTLEKDCDLAAVRALNYHYLYINQYWPAGLAEKCLKQLPLQLEYAASVGSEYAQIYRLAD